MAHIAFGAMGQTSSVAEDVNYTYNPDNFVLQESKQQSNGDIISTFYQYPKDLMAMLSCTPLGDAIGIANLAAKNIINAPIETYQTVTTAGVTKVISAELYTFNFTLPYPRAMYKLETEVPMTSFAPYHVGPGCSFSKDPAYVLQEQYNAYDDYGNLLEKQIRDNNRKTSYIYGYKGAYKIAVINNAGNNQVGYSSFETNETGFWTYSDAGVTDMGSAGFAGPKAYALSPGAPITRAVPVGKYIVSFWQTAGFASASGSSASVTTSMTGPTIGGWTYYEFTIANTNSIAVSAVASGDMIDELRLYPASAEMETIGYLPLVGMSYSCDVGSHMSYYTYDDLGRLLYIKNQDGKIVKQMEYGIQKTE